MALSQKHVGKMLVPWFNCNEWKYVDDLIFGDSTTDASKKEALAILQIWKKRSPKLPSGVEGTLIILDALLLQTTATLPEDKLRILYGTAIMRFLNLCGANADKQGSLYQKAKQNNLPIWLVNLRHDVAHDQVIPSKFMLQMGLEFCLDWLKHKYWKPQRATIVDFISDASCNSSVEVALELYCQLKLLCFSNENFSISDVEFVNPALYEAICSVKSIEIDQNMNVLNTATLLLQNIRDAITYENKQHLANLISKLLVSDSGLLATHILRKENDCDQIPRNFVCMWKSIIELLYEQNMLAPLLGRLLKFSSFADADEHTRNIASLWLAEIFKSLLVAKEIGDKYLDLPGNDSYHKKTAVALLKMAILKEMQELHEPFDFDFENYQDVLQDIHLLQANAVSNPHKFTLAFLKYLLKLCSYPEDYINEIQLLIKSYVIPQDTVVGTQSALHTVNEIQSLFPEITEPVSTPPERTEEEANPVQTTSEAGENNTPQRWRVLKDKSIVKGCPLGVLACQNRDMNPLLERCF